MTWTRISDDWDVRVGEADLSPEAERFALRAMVYCNRAENDGALSAKGLRQVGADFDHPRALVNELIEKFGWVEEIDNGIIQIPWEDQESSEAIQRRRKANRERQRKFQQRGQELREKRLQEQGVTRESHLPPSRPVPSQGQGKGKGKENLGSASPPPVVPADAVLPDGPSVSSVVRMEIDPDDENCFMILGDMETQKDVMIDALHRAKTKLDKYKTGHDIGQDRDGYHITVTEKAMGSSFLVKKAVIEANQAAGQL